MLLLLLFLFWLLLLILLSSLGKNSLCQLVLESSLKFFILRWLVYPNKFICECWQKVLIIVKEVAKMWQLIKIFVKNDLFGSENLPDQNNRRFYQRLWVICSFMYHTMKTLRKLIIDWDCLIDKLNNGKQKTRVPNSIFVQNVWEKKSCWKKMKLAVKMKIVTTKMKRRDIMPKG